MGAGARTQMSPFAFVKKWKSAALNERQSAQEHFIDLCALVGHPTPTEDDPTGEFFAFEKGASKVGGGRGFADVWKRDHFAWEYKQKNGDLDGALLQLMRYAPALENPPLHVVCDIKRFRVHTAWTNTVPTTYEITLDDITDPHKREILHNVFFNPEKLKPTRTRAGLTKDAADKFSTIAWRLQGRGSPEEIAHFVNQLVFCFFAQSVGLLRGGIFTKLLRRAAQDPSKARGYLNDLFHAMEKGGDFALTDVMHFNGGLFDGRRALPLDEGDIGLLIAANSLDWSLIDPTIFGTLFERFLDPQKRAQIGAHYTDADKIARIIDPVILRPLRAEWEVTKGKIVGLLDGTHPPPMRKKERRRMTRDEAAEEVRSQFVEKLCNLKILDPACGSGNFLYLALQGVKDIENRANLDCEMLGLKSRWPTVGPEVLLGIETNALAAELARTTIWIGDIQWRLRNGIHTHEVPVLRKLNSIERADALIERVPPPDRGGQMDLLEGAETGSAYRAATWPRADFIVGNPPFLGAKLMKRRLGVEYVVRLRAAYAGRLQGFSDLVCYWFEKARAEVAAGRTRGVGLVATSSIRGGTNRPVMDAIARSLAIHNAWSEQPWTIEGARVEVSLVCFCAPELKPDQSYLDGQPVSNINPDLTTGIDLTLARALTENERASFFGIQTSGPHDVTGEVARRWMCLPINPNGRHNRTILKPYWNGDDVTGRPRDRWLIDLPLVLSDAEASQYEVPYEYLRAARYDPDSLADLRSLTEARATARDQHARVRWWEPYWPRPEMRSQIERLSRYIVTTETSQHRLFVWLRYPTLPDKNLIVIARDDDTTFGILHSRFHEIWSLRLGTSLEDRPRYTSTTTFATFPFPDGLTPNIPIARLQRDPHAVAIAQAARRLDDLRNAWLNPSDLVRMEPEVVPGFPDRILPKDTAAAAILRERTLTNLYNRRPQWLVNVHRELDAAVAEAYGWPADISDEDALARLLELNLARAAADESGLSARLTKGPPKPDGERRQTHMKLPITGKAGKQVGLQSPESPSQSVEEEPAAKRGRSRRRAS
ncbi:class I SAM-dependent DNA methyltransferase (plasmid) [Xanthobacter dioxanivorans]|uniref:site-specific DNA-methyltransferase (adenine-specific) n=1 Tax=Xanthobacter dioxanivorans TaxID=2528964 RepID=A0A974PUX9_9HYPH|nr:DNA methyltransferase [Xanthobacter dioxanivorans]QRG10170.1 class I SAM-dependent DNA methyltransferase [Xanthobacter dioxanivorans]